MTSLADRIAALPEAPLRSFASDNAAGAHPRVIEAVIQANTGHALAYGEDRWTAEASDRLRDLFGPTAEPYLVWNGTGANVMSLASMIQPGDCVVCSEWAHIAVDEAGAPERVLGTKLLTLPTADGKLVPEQLGELAHLQGDQHHTQPGVVSITQSSELGTLYTVDEIAAICDIAHRMGMLVHLDGARLGNATAALGGTRQALRAMTTDAGVDVVSFGATKNGALGAESVIFLNPALTRRAKWIRKQVNQLPSKMRFVAAQFNALLEGDLWIELATHANAMSALLFERASTLPGISGMTRPAVNSLFPCIDPQVASALRDWCFFWDWDVSINQVRWMTSWDTTEEDIDQFLAGARQLLLLT